MTDRYLLDTVTLSRMSVRQRGSAFVGSCCHIPEEILFEAQGLPDIEQLRNLNYPVTPWVLRKVVEVMSSMRPRDRVIDLYNNKGNGDVMLLATALAEMEVSAGQLIGDRWVIATGDNGLAAKAHELSVETCASDWFIGLLAEAS